MISKNEIKRVKSLHRKKGRDNENCFLVEGDKMVGEAIDSPYDIVQLYVRENSQWSDKEGARLISESEMNQISTLKTPSPSLAVVRSRSIKNGGVENKTLVLDGISDPGNLGTIIRTADWFGFKHVVVSENTVEEYNPKTVQASMGSIFRVQIHRTQLVPFIERIKQERIPVLGAVLGGDNSANMGAYQSACLVIGSESHGISQEVLKQLDVGITIPQKGGAESLNASVATGILLHTWSC